MSSKYLAVLDSKGNKIKVIEPKDLKEKDWTDAWKRGIDLNMIQANKNVTQPMRQSYIINRAINLIADTAPLAPLTFFRGMDQIDPGHPLVKLFKRPSPKMSYYELMSITAMFYKLDGEVFWYLNQSIGQAAGTSSVPAEIIVINPKAMKEVLNPNRTLKGWLFNNKIALRPDEVIHFKTNNPYNSYRGLNPIDSIIYEIKADYKASQYQEGFFERGALPGFVLKTHEEDNTPQEELEKYGRMWDQQHGGFDKSYKTAVLRGGMDFKVVGLNQKQMEFIDSRIMSRDIVLQLFGVPKAVFGATEEMNRATAEAHEKTFWDKNIKPFLMRMESKINAEVVYYIDPSITAKFDFTKVPILKNLFKEDIESAWKLFQIGFSKNELNERFDFGFREDTDIGDYKYVMMNLINVNEDQRFAPEPAPGKELNSEVINKEVEIKTIRKRRNLKRFLRYHNQLEKEMRPVIYNYFEMQKRVVLSNLTNNKADNDYVTKAEDYTDLYSRISNIWDNENKVLALKITPYMKNTVETGQKYALDTLGFTDREAVINDGLILRRINKITRINNTVWNQIKIELHEGVTNGETIADIASRIKDKVYGVSKQKSLQIARSEVTGAMGEATLEEYKTNGVPKVEWLDAGDDKVRDSHSLNASVGPLPTGSTFPSGETYPGENSVNCRCALSPVTQ